VPAVKAVVPLLTGSREVRFEIVPGGHLGMLTGRSARTTTWRVMDEWISRWSTEEPGAAEASDARAEAEPTIGTNRSRKHGSAGSRALSS
jgi:polyhydroxyalkanoate synthase subunit PhaC